MQDVLRKVLEKVFITKKYTQCKTGTLKIDVFLSPYERKIEKVFFKI